MRFGADGAAQVRLDNGHMLTTRPWASGRTAAALAGAKVRVELGLQELKGWRLVRQP